MTLPAIIDLSDLDGIGFVIQGDGEDDLAGRSVANAGDINGDGYDDLIVGAPGGDDGGDGAGEAYVIFGRRGGFGTIDLAALVPSQGFVIQGDAVDDRTGWSVSGAGDINGDGYDDLIVGAPGYGGGAAGAAYVIFGKADGFGNIDLGALAPADGFVIDGDAANDGAGFSVSGAGDINGDGYDDLIIGAPGADDSGNDAGKAYVIFGKGSGFSDIDLGALAPGDGFVMLGDAAIDLAGWSVSNAGDINGDGYGELIVGAPQNSVSPPNAGEAYVIFGKAGGFSDIDLGALALADGFVIQGDASYDAAGWSVSGAGDVNGDGYDDLIVGAPFGDGGGSYSGQAYVIFGKAGGFSDIDLAALDPADGFVIVGQASNEDAGYSVSSAGDVNGDGIDDLIVGARFGDDGGTNAGEAYLIFGKTGGFGDIDLGALDPADGVVIRGAAAFDFAGVSVSGAGDVNGDGFDDLMVGADYGGADDSGEAYVIFGSGGEVSGFPAIFEIADDLNDRSGAIIRGAYGGSYLGWSVSDAGDVNGDGIADVIVGAPNYDGYGYYGYAYVIYGKVGGIGEIDVGALDPADGFAIKGAYDGDTAGWSVAAAGDVNGDGIDDIIVGAIHAYSDYAGYAGRAYVIFGQDGGLGFVDLNSLDPDDGFAIGGAADGSYTGWSVAGAGDVNGDGFADIVVGASGYGGKYGAAYVVFGKADGFADIDLASLDPDDGFTIFGGEFDMAGFSVSSAGDVNGDGVDDFLVGAPFDGFDPSTPDHFGAAFLIFGRTEAEGGFTDIDLAALDPDDGVALFGTPDPLGADFPPFFAGGSVSGAGDVNGDGFDDLIIGAPLSYSDCGCFKYGAAYVVFGRDDGGLGTLDLGNLTPDDGFVIRGFGGDEYLGLSVSGAGDVNGDGFADLIVGAPYSFFYGSSGTFAAAGDPEPGGAYVVFGKAGGFGTIDFAAGVDPDDGFFIAGVGSGDAAGHSVSAAGDVNGDGFDDLIVGAPYAGADCGCGGYGEGAAYIIYGRGAVPVDDPIVTAENVVATGNVFANNGLGPDRVFMAPIEIGEVNGSAANVGVQIELASGALLTVNADGSYSYDPNGEFGHLPAARSGAANMPGADSFTYTLLNGLTATVTITINGVDTQDFLDGTPGNDRLNGGIAVDRMRGGDGDDLYVVDNSRDKVEENPDSGIDGVTSTVDYKLGDNVENIVLAGNGNISATGNALANGILGNDGNNVLNGMGGADVMNGGRGNDVYFVDDPGDVVRETEDADGIDLIKSSISLTLPRGVEQLVLTGVADINGTGNSEANVLRGNDGANVLNGGAGADLMKGGRGNDTYIVDNAGDVVEETNADDGIDLVVSSVDFALTRTLENLTLAGTATNGTGTSAANVITGNSVANVLRGEAGNDQLNGGSGNDQLFGGTGDDTIKGDAGNDQIHGGEGNDILTGGAGQDGFYMESVLNALTNVDQIVDFSAPKDTIFLHRGIFSGIAANGTLAASAFQAGNVALDANDRILYDASTGEVFYDADGSGGAAAAILFATVAPGTALSHADFVAFM